MATTTPHVNITVNHNDLEKDLKKVLKIIRPNWMDKDIHFKGTERSVNAGLMNIMVICYSTDDVKDAVMCRIYREMKVNSSLSPKYESNVMQLVHDQYGFSANILATLNNGYCYEYIKGEVMTTSTVQLEDNWQLIAKQLALLHSTKPDNEMKNKSNILIFFESLIPTYPESLPNPQENEKFKKYLPSKSVLLNEYKLVQDHVLSVGSASVFCHGDTRPENMVWNKETGEIIFVDWECSGMGEQAFELAYHFLKCAGVEKLNFSTYPNKKFQLKFLRVYLETFFSIVNPNVAVTNHDLEKLYVQVRAHHLLLLIQCTGFISGVSQFENDFPFDFLGSSISHYEEYKQVKDEILALKLV